MTKGEKGYSQTGRSIAPGTGTFPGGQQAVCRRRIGSETCFHRISETEQKFFEFPFQKAQFLQVCLLVSACIGSYFKKLFSFSRQCAPESGPRRLPVALPTTCCRAESEQRLFLKTLAAGCSSPAVCPLPASSQP